MDQIFAGMNIYTFFLLAGGIVGIVFWFSRLENKVNSTDKTLVTYMETEKEARELRDANELRARERREADQTRINDRLSESIAMTGAKLTVVEHNITEIKATAVTRHDLRDLKTELTDSINQVGDRTVAEVNRMVQVIAAAKADDSKPARASRAKPAA